MDWDKLRTFCIVADAHSFTSAGDLLGLSQSAISRQISGLEDSLGVMLFHRHARGLVLTEQGELLYKTAHDVFEKLSTVEGQIQDSKQREDGPLRITVSEFIGSTWLVPRLVTIREDRPDLQITILMDDRIYNLGMREADVAIRLYKPDQQDLVQRHLATLNFNIYASKEYLEKHGRPKTVADLKHHTLIGYPPNVAQPFTDTNWLFNLAGVNAEVDYNVIMINSLYAIFRAVRRGAGIAALPRYMVGHYKDRLEVLLEDQVRDPVDLYFVYPEERRHSRRISIFRDFLINNLHAVED
ncbi:MAG: LysR family transcriptional regulator [Rhodospirillales bacterium]|nr:LysR family transcriptional regulator [Rhodospirillales bacterium]MCB9973028.1 LysR family transcriptional regulator [Rhodospirillales bacterium]